MTFDCQAWTLSSFFTKWQCICFENITVFFFSIVFEATLEGRFKLYSQGHLSVWHLLLLIKRIEMMVLTWKVNTKS